MIFEQVKKKKAVEWRQLRAGEMEGWKYGMISFSQESFGEEYPKDNRTYFFTAENDVFKPDATGSALYATSLDLKEKDVELTQYIATINPWIIEGCWIISEGDYKALVSGGYANKSE